MEMKYVPGRLAHVVHAADVRVGDLPGDAHLIEEPRQTGVMHGRRPRQELQRDRLVQLEIVGPVHLAHAAAAQQATIR